MPPPVLRDTRPSFLVAGAPVPGLSSDLIRLEIVEDLDGMCRAEAGFVNWGTVSGRPGFLHFGPQSPLDLGATLEIRVNTSTLFKGRISAVEGEFPAGSAAPSLVVLAEDRLQDLRMTRRTRAFERKTDQQILDKIVTDHGLTLEGQLDGPAHASVGQLNQSDLAFLRDRARRAGLDLWLEGTTLKVSAKREPQAEVPALAYGAELQGFRVVADLAEQASTVLVSGWDARRAEAIEGKATVELVRPELGRGERSGPGLLEERLGARVSAVVHTLPCAAAEAKAEAEARMLQLARRFVRGSGSTDRVLAVRVGRSVELNGLGPRFSGRYAVVATRIRFDGAEGLRAEFTVERPGFGSPA